jgi:uncharacterized protein (DUF2235 family)
MLQKVGLLPICNTVQLPFAWSMYVRDDDEGLKLSMAFKRAFSIEVKIEFLGVWYVLFPTFTTFAFHPFSPRDTVQSVGLIPRHLPFSGSNNAIVHFRHAIALDEHRVKFVPSFCTGGKSKADKDKHEEWRKKHSHREQSGSVATYETAVNESSGIDTDVLEVFFAGAHCGKSRFSCSRVLSETYPSLIIIIFY